MARHNGMGSSSRKQSGHPCDICGEMFPSGRALGGHKRRHTAERMRKLIASQVEQTSGWQPPSPGDRTLFAAALTALDLAASRSLSEADRDTLVAKDEEYLDRVAGQLTPRFYLYELATDEGFELARAVLAPRLQARGLDILFRREGRTLFVRRV